jgi:starvation-inducible DNA-binding protein
MQPNIGLSDANREGVVNLLTPLLADEYVLYTKTRNYHWNVVGPHFAALHKVFEAQYDALEGFVDEIAERIRQLGAPSPGTMAEFTAAARLRERPGEYPDARGMIAALVADHEAVIRALRADLATAQEKFGDAGTGDFLTGLMEKHEKMAWLLRANLEGGASSTASTPKGSG